jgi:hypothetical protein
LEELQPEQTPTPPPPNPEQTPTPPLPPDPKKHEMASPSGATVNKTRTEPSEKEHGNKPPKFTGQRHEYRNFMSKMKIHLQLNEKKYSTPVKKILAFISYLDGEARQWGQLWINAQPPTSKTNSAPNDGTYDAFVEVFNQNYKPTDEKRTALNELDRLQQGSMPANEFITKFKLLAREAKLLGTTPGTTDQPADVLLQEKFQQAMNQGLWMHINTEETPPNTLEGWCERAIVRDDQWRTSQRSLNIRGFSTFRKRKSMTSTSQITVELSIPRKTPRSNAERVMLLLRGTRASSH